MEDKREERLLENLVFPAGPLTAGGGQGKRSQAEGRRVPGGAAHPQFTACGRLSERLHRGLWEGPKLSNATASQRQELVLPAKGHLGTPRSLRWIPVPTLLTALSLTTTLSVNLGM